MGPFTPGVLHLLEDSDGTTASTVGVFNKVRTDFGFDTYGTGVGFEIRIEGSIDKDNWFPLTYITGPGYSTLLRSPCAYLRAVFVSLPTSGVVTCAVAGK